MCPLSVQVCLGLAVVTLHHYNLWLHQSKIPRRPRKGQFGLLCFRRYRLCTKGLEHEWAQHSPLGHT